MIRKFEVWVSTGMAGGTRKATFEICDDDGPPATEGEIESMDHDVLGTLMEWGYSEIIDDQKTE